MNSDTSRYVVHALLGTAQGQTHLISCAGMIDLKTKTLTYFDDDKIVDLAKIMAGSGVFITYCGTNGIYEGLRKHFGLNGHFKRKKNHIDMALKLSLGASISLAHIAKLNFDIDGELFKKRSPFNMEEKERREICEAQTRIVHKIHEAMDRGEHIKLRNPPNYTNNKPLLKIVSIPKPTWGRNVRTMLPKGCWKVIREIVFQQYGKECFYCKDNGARSSLHCHELWKYDDESQVQRLHKVIPVCEACHDVLHAGRSFAIGKREEVLEHLARVNKWSQSSVTRHVRSAMEQWERRSGKKWKVDISFATSLLDEHRVAESTSKRFQTHIAEVSLPLEKVSVSNYVALDFETSGLSPWYGDVVIEVGAVKVVNGEIVNRYQRLINPGFQISGEIRSLTGITNEMLSQGEEAHVVFPELLNFIGDNTVIAHKAEFEERFLISELSRLDCFSPFNLACTLRLAKRIMSGMESYRLSSLVKDVGISFDSQFHRALADAEATHLIFSHMINVLSTKFPTVDITHAHIRCINDTKPINLKKKPELLDQIMV